MVPLPIACNFSFPAAVTVQFRTNGSYFVNQLKLLVQCLVAPLSIHQSSSILLVDAEKTALLSAISATFVSVSLTEADLRPDPGLPSSLARAGYGGWPSAFHREHCLSQCPFSPQYLQRTSVVWLLLDSFFYGLKGFFPFGLNLPFLPCASKTSPESGFWTGATFRSWRMRAAERSSIVFDSLAFISK